VSDVGNKKLDEKEIFEEIESLTQCYSMKTYNKRGNKRLKIEQKE
jgi:predicted site-specific integrase-resolvase